jgi:RecB family endonuclease NucS
MNLEEMSKDERSLLLYIETCVVDYAGLIHSLKINEDDRTLLKKWDESGFISWSRITFKSLQLLSDKHRSTLVRLSEEAWTLAHQERRNRALRMTSQKPYCDLITTKTKNAVFVEGSNENPA